MHGRSPYSQQKLCNKISGYVVHPMRWIQMGLVRGITIKLQEEERERCGDCVPEVSALYQITELEPDTQICRSLSLQL
jgi:small subunit ribosomal protein S17e